MTSALRLLGDDIAAAIDSSWAPSAKPGPSKIRRVEMNRSALARFRVAIDRLGELGWSWQRIANYLGDCTKQHVMSLHGGNGYVPGYMLDALDELPELESLRPARVRAEQLRKVG